MDKSPGDQLNRAYDAYKQACFEKERFRKELQQKTDFYEQQSRDQQKQIAKLKEQISMLTSQLSLFGGADGRKRESAPLNIPLEQLEDQLRASLQRERHYEDQLEIQKCRVQEMEDEQYKLKSTLSSKNEEIQHLKILLKEAKARQEKEPRTIYGHEAQMRSKNLIVDRTATFDLNENERQSVERIFSDIKEEFRWICKLTREQRSQLNTFLPKKGPASGNGPLEQFSMPVQCTDEENKEAQQLPKPSMNMVPSFTPITARGLAPDLDVTISVESLSNLSVKFPPTSDESEFLKSSTENSPILPQTLERKKTPRKIHTKALPFLRKHSLALSSPPYSPCSPKTVGHIDNGKLTEIGPDLRDPFVSGSEDSSFFAAANSPAGKGTDVFSIPDISDVGNSLEVTKTVRGPQQPIWKPSSHEDNDPSLSLGEKWDGDSSDICEFCQAVFPPSTRAGGEFLRHLNSHFLGQS
ncbi:TRAF family member-associated NF-kappa-B activator [Gastrophryne carolinensis]